LQLRIRFTRRTSSTGSASITGDSVFAQPEFDQTPRTSPPQNNKRTQAGGAAFRVAAGILISRITGLARERAIAYYFGNSAVADAFRAAIRIPNLLNNLFGEGVLSASFVTVYSKLRAQGKEGEADHVARAVFGLLAVVCSVLVLVGVLLTPLLIDIIAPGFSGEKRDLTIHLVRIHLPGTGLLVMCAWCLGILN
jgi:putative peptidoglycan lipid II flippase